MNYKKNVYMVVLGLFFLSCFSIGYAHKINYEKVMSLFMAALIENYYQLGVKERKEFKRLDKLIYEWSNIKSVRKKKKLMKTIKKGIKYQRNMAWGYLVLQNTTVSYRIEKLEDQTYSLFNNAFKKSGIGPFEKEKIRNIINVLLGKKHWKHLLLTLKNLLDDKRIEWDSKEAFRFFLDQLPEIEKAIIKYVGSKSMKFGSFRVSLAKDEPLDYSVDDEQDSGIVFKEEKMNRFLRIREESKGNTLRQAQDDNRKKGIIHV